MDPSEQKGIGTAGDLNGDGFSDIFMRSFYLDGEAENVEIWYFYCSSTRSILWQRSMQLAKSTHKIPISVQNLRAGNYTLYMQSETRQQSFRFFKINNP